MSELIEASPVRSVGSKCDYPVHMQLIRDNINHISELLGCGPGDIEISFESIPFFAYQYFDFGKNYLINQSLSCEYESFDSPYGLIPKSRHSDYYQVCYAKNSELKVVMFAVSSQANSISSHYTILRKVDCENYKNLLNNFSLKRAQKNKPILGNYKELYDKTIGFLKNRKIIEEYGAKVRRGYVFSGDPGNGKTMLCKHLEDVVKSMGLYTKRVTASFIEECFLKNTMENLFSCHLNIVDDVDIAYFSRKGDSRKACALLSAMDGMFEQSASVIIFTTNEKTDSLDRAFLRPGRIDEVIEFHPPDRELRSKFYETWMPSMQRLSNRNFAELTENFSFAELDAIRSHLVSLWLKGKESNDDFVFTASMLLDSIRHVNNSRLCKTSQQKIGF